MIQKQLIVLEGLNLAADNGVTEALILHLS